MSDVYVVAAYRTPIGRFLGGFSKLTAVDLGVALVPQLLERVGVPAASVDELIFGCARQAGAGPNPARQIAIRSGMHESKTAYTVNMACGSGLLSIIQGMQSIQRGDSDLVLTGGTESMSRLPYYLENARDGYRLGHGQLVDGMYRDGFQCPLADQLMGATAENLADEFSISRELTANDVDGWDSLKHIELIVAVETRFKVRFKTAEVGRLNNVGDLIDKLSEKLS